MVRAATLEAPATRSVLTLNWSRIGISMLRIQLRLQTSLDSFSNCLISNSAKKKRGSFGVKMVHKYNSENNLKEKDIWLGKLRVEKGHGFSAQHNKVKYRGQNSTPITKQKNIDPWSKLRLVVQIPSLSFCFIVITQFWIPLLFWNIEVYVGNILNVLRIESTLFIFHPIYWVFF